MKKPLIMYKLSTVCCQKPVYRHGNRIHCTNCLQRSSFKRISMDKEEEIKTVSIYPEYKPVSSLSQIDREEEATKRRIVVDNYEALKVNADTLSRLFIESRIAWNINRIYQLTN